MIGAFAGDVGSAGPKVPSSFCGLVLKIGGRGWAGKKSGRLFPVFLVKGVPSGKCLSWLSFRPGKGDPLLVRGIDLALFEP